MIFLQKIDTENLSFIQIFDFNLSFGQFFFFSCLFVYFCGCSKGFSCFIGFLWYIYILSISSYALILFIRNIATVILICLCFILACTSCPNFAFDWSVLLDIYLTCPSTQFWVYYACFMYPAFIGAWSLFVSQTKNMNQGQSYFIWILWVFTLVNQFLIILKGEIKEVLSSIQFQTPHLATSLLFCAIIFFMLVVRIGKIYIFYAKILMRSFCRQQIWLYDQVFL